MLLDKGADVNAQGGMYGNALRAASEEGHDQVMRMLLDKGADVNAQGGVYGNALQAASERGYDQVVRMLLDKGADTKGRMSTLKVESMVTLCRQRQKEVMIKWCGCC
ncbi:ankyrin repeat domain containing protein [Lasallia pustulata]|uniref:Ankyrin repeat domain containing protein n=1 Tax=Lasallia pustulata TaxID=136370 RepID=A0A1W5D2S5_9LECA|nr:ankyrin repeat domain containing protein [Lasallia pustulata]